MKYHAIITHFFELVAALAGFYYLRKYNNSKLRPMVYFLVFTICVEAIGSYTSFIKVVEFLKPINKTIFRYNFWLYNSYIIISLFFYLKFYHNILSIEFNKKILKIFFIASIILIPIGICFENIFNVYIKFNFLWTSFCVFVCVVLYFYEILISDKILKFYQAPLFYISIGLLIWWLIFPLMIFYMPYYKEIYPEVINFRAFILIGTNAVLYGCYTTGFLWGKE